jgi:hypothetical protein
LHITLQKSTTIPAQSLSFHTVPAANFKPPSYERNHYIAKGAIYSFYNSNVNILMKSLNVVVNTCKFEL